MKMIDDKLLKSVSGGELIEDKVEFYKGFIPLFKKVGLSKEDFLDAAKKEWLDNYRKFSTDGSEEDFNQLMNKLYEEYDSYERPE